MKRFIALMFAVCLLFLSGCGEQKKGEVNPYSAPLETGITDPGSGIDPEAEPEGTYHLSGGDDTLLSLENDDSDNKITTDMVEKGTSVPTLQTKWDNMNFIPTKGGADAEADALRDKILNSANTDQYYTWTGKTYYVSPDGDNDNDGMSPATAVKTLDADVFLLTPPSPGDAVLFERGGLWRMVNTIRARAGVIYGSYGTGEKPTFYGSAKNYADEKLWIASNKENVWKISIIDSDVGIVVFNHGELVGRKRYNGLTVLEENGDYFFKDDTLYVYSDRGNPGKCYYDIEIGANKEAFTAGIRSPGCTFDNLKIKYNARGGIYTSVRCDNVTVTNCELGFIGGATHHDQTRFGNAIQQWNSAQNHRIEYNWIYQIFDTGYSFQGSDLPENNPGTDDEGNMLVGDRAYYEDFTIRYNLIEYCNYALELWHQRYDPDPAPVQIVNLDCSHNILRYSGYGWGGMQRKNFTGYNYYTGPRNFKNAKNCSINNNIFDLSSRWLVYWTFTGPVLGEWSIYNNTFYQARNNQNDGMYFGKSVNSYDQSSLELGVSIFDQSPKLVAWIE